jgi:4-hydroxy-2-oxoheptanedioate aldolase
MQNSTSESHFSLPNVNLSAPLGGRSFSPWVFTPGISDASLYSDDSFNMKTSNNHIAVIPQIESVKGIANAEEIASIPGISALMFGPGDFMADAGLQLALGGQPHPTLFSAMESMAKAGKKYDVPLFG